MSAHSLAEAPLWRGFSRVEGRASLWGPAFFSARAQRPSGPAPDLPLSRIVSASLLGVDGVAVEVEVRVSSQLPRVDIVGLPAAAVRESAARVRAAIAAVGQRFPERRVTVNLAPADLRKTGASLDLAIAIGVLTACGAIETDAGAQTAFVGELALDGRLRPLRGALALAHAARDCGCKQLIAPDASAAEAALTPDLDVRAAQEQRGSRACCRSSTTRRRSRSRASTAWRGRCAALELGKLVEEQHAAVRERDLAGSRRIAASEQTGRARRVMRRAERPLAGERTAQRPGHAVDARDLERLVVVELR